MDALYDEFGNYVGPELDDDSDGGSGEDQDEVRAKRSFVDSTANAPDRSRFPNDRADRALLFVREVSSSTSSPSSPPPDPLTLHFSHPRRQDDAWMEQAEREADARNAEGAGAMDVEEEEDNRGGDADAA